MQDDNKNQGIVWFVSVMVLATYLLSDSTIVKGIENTRKCGFLKSQYPQLHHGHSDAGNTLFIDCESLFICCENGILPLKIHVIINCNLLRFCMERQRTSKALTLEYVIFV